MINYLNSEPDSLHNNQYWNSAEKVKFKNFDLSTPYLYQFPSKQLLNYYKPTILSIEKEGDYYGIRTIFRQMHFKESIESQIHGVSQNFTQ